MDKSKAGTIALTVVITAVVGFIINSMLDTYKAGSDAAVANNPAVVQIQKDVAANTATLNRIDGNLQAIADNMNAIIIAGRSAQ